MSFKSCKRCTELARLHKKPGWEISCPDCFSKYYQEFKNDQEEKRKERKVYLEEVRKNFRPWSA